jgi:hypothetical protein
VGVVNPDELVGKVLNHTLRELSVHFFISFPLV